MKSQNPLIKQIIKNGSKPKSHRSEQQEGNEAPARTRRIWNRQGLGSLDHGPPSKPVVFMCALCLRRVQQQVEMIREANRLCSVELR